MNRNRAIIVVSALKLDKDERILDAPYITELGIRETRRITR